MRKLLLSAFFAFIGITLFSSNHDAKNCQSKVFQEKKYSKAKIETFVREVFKDKADELVFNSNSRRLEIITEFLNRFEIVERPEYEGKKFALLSTVAINNKYNSELKRDTYYNENTFNPLKYDFNMASKEFLFYRLDNSNYIIRIFPIK